MFPKDDELMRASFVLRCAQCANARTAYSYTLVGSILSVSCLRRTMFGSPLVYGCITACTRVTSLTRGPVTSCPRSPPWCTIATTFTKRGQSVRSATCTACRGSASMRHTKWPTGGPAQRICNMACISPLFNKEYQACSKLLVNAADADCEARTQEWPPCLWTRGCQQPRSLMTSIQV